MTPVGNVFIVGPMGAGKTTVGRRLASSLGMDFVDTDHEIEERTGVDVAFIFEKEGEAGFRAREHKVIEELSARRKLVLATGGGAVVMAENRALLSARGYVIYLRASVAKQVARTAKAQHRPLLEGTDREQRLRGLFEQRDPLYREIADLTIEADHQSAKQLLAEIRDAMDQQLSG